MPPKKKSSSRKKPARKPINAKTKATLQKKAKNSKPFGPIYI